MSKHIGGAKGGAHSNNIHRHANTKKVSSPTAAKTQKTDFVKPGSGQDNFLKTLHLKPSWERIPSPVRATRPNGDPVKVNYLQVKDAPADKPRHGGTSRYDVLPHYVDHPKGFPGGRYRGVNPKRAAEGVKGNRALLFPLNNEKVRMVDGNGKSRGFIIPKSVKLNYAQVKVINGEEHYYAFATKISDDGKHYNTPGSRKNHQERPASGWIPASAVKAGNDPQFSPRDVKAGTAPPVGEVHGKYENYDQYTVKRDYPREILGKDKQPKYGYMENGKFISYKVLPGKTKEQNDAASDYLRRNGGVINLGFNAAGVSNDTFKMNDKEPLVFHRAPASVKSATIDVNLYEPKDLPKSDGTKVVGKMRFVYGYVESEGSKRWGWMPLGALDKKG